MRCRAVLHHDIRRPWAATRSYSAPHRAPPCSGVAVKIRSAPSCHRLLSCVRNDEGAIESIMTRQIIRRRGDRKHNGQRAMRWPLSALSALAAGSARVGLVRRRRDLLDHLADLALAGGSLVEREIGLSDDAHTAPTVIPPRHAADLPLRHDFLHGCDVIIGTATLRVV